MIKLFIIGSCVSRDAFDKKFTKDRFEISQYNARTSLARLKYEITHISEEEINLKSNFQKRVVTKAINGNILEDLKEKEFNYLILDFVDDRFGLVKLNDKDIFVTFSDELKNSKYNRKYKDKNSSGF